MANAKHQIIIQPTVAVEYTIQLIISSSLIQADMKLFLTHLRKGDYSQTFPNRKHSISPYMHIYYKIASFQTVTHKARTAALCQYPFLFQ